MRASEALGWSCSLSAFPDGQKASKIVPAVTVSMCTSKLVLHEKCVLSQIWSHAGPQIQINSTTKAVWPKSSSKRQESQSPLTTTHGHWSKAHSQGDLVAPSRPQQLLLLKLSSRISFSLHQQHTAAFGHLTGSKQSFPPSSWSGISCAPSPLAPPTFHSYTQ